jgi:Peptidase family M48
MLTALCAVALAWQVPSLLTPLTARGIGARLGLTAWVTAMASALACAAAALRYLVTATISGWPGLAATVCRSVVGRACASTVYRSALFELALAGATIAAGLTVAALAWRYGRTMRRSAQAARVHGEAARITGRGLLGAPAAVVLDAPQPAAYCIPGRRPATIVLTTGALAVLDLPQLSAVLAHERAHLSGRHHLLIALTRALAACLPGVPLFSDGARQVARLAEMCADDTAARRGGRPSLVAALLAMGTGEAVPTTALAATGGSATARVQRLLEPPRRARDAGYRLALAAVTILLALVPVLTSGVAGPLGAHGIMLP